MISGEAQTALLDVIRRVQSLYIGKFRFSEIQRLFDDILSAVLDFTDTEYGFLGDVLHTPEGKPYLKTRTLTNIAWNDETRAFYAKHAADGLEFTNLNTLFGVTLRTGEITIANDPANDPRAGGVPKGHPPLQSFLGVPLISGGIMVGMLGIANRPEGFDEAYVEYLDPLFSACANIIAASKAALDRRAERDLAARRIEFLQTLNRISADVSLDTDHQIMRALSAGRVLKGMQVACVAALDEKYSTIVHVSGDPSVEFPARGEQTRLVPGFGLELVKESDVFSMTDIMGTDLERHDWYRKYGCRAFIRATCQVPGLHPHVVYLLSREQREEPFDQGDLELVKLLAHWIAAAMLRQRTMASLEERERGLAIINQRLTLAAEAAGIGIFDWNIAEDRLHWDDRMHRIYGTDPVRFSGKYNAWTAQLHPDDAERARQEAREALEHEDKYQSDFRIIRPDGEVHYIQMHGVILRDEAGKPMRLTGVNMDVTRQVTAELETTRARDEAEQANRVKSEFLASMSHELRTPLNAVIGFAELLKLDPQKTLGPEQHEYLENVLVGGVHLLGLVNDLLDLVRVETGRYKMSVDAVDPADVVAGSISQVATLAEARGITIVDEVKTCDGLAVQADDFRLRQCLMNLLTNAIKYNCDGGRVVIRCMSAEEGWVRLSIGDTGIGIPADQHDRVFRMFERIDADPLVARDGTGIGLFITRLLVERMNGRLSFDSEEGVGSTFDIDLPATSA